VHPGNPDYPLDAEAVTRQAKKFNKLLEINNSSFHVRHGSLEPCRRFASLAAEHEVMVAVNSDSHFAADIGRCEKAAEVLAETGLATEMVVNSSMDKIHLMLEWRRERLSKL